MRRGEGDSLQLPTYLPAAPLLTQSGAMISTILPFMGGVRAAFGIRNTYFWEPDLVGFGIEDTMMNRSSMGDRFQSRKA